MLGARLLDNAARAAARRCGARRNGTAAGQLGAAARRAARRSAPPVGGYTRAFEPWGVLGAAGVWRFTKPSASTSRYSAAVYSHAPLCVAVVVICRGLCSPMQKRANPTSMGHTRSGITESTASSLRSKSWRSRSDQRNVVTGTYAPATASMVQVETEMHARRSHSACARFGEALASAVIFFMTETVAVGFGPECLV